MTWWHVLQHWLAVHTGTVNESGPFYGFWSGFGSDIGEVTILAAVIGMFRHHNCGVHRCLRLGKHEYEMDGVTHKLCRKHHPAVPDAPLTHSRILDHHAKRVATKGS